MQAEGQDREAEAERGEVSGHQELNQQKETINEKELIGHGAEAKIYRLTEGQHTYVIKQRVPKKYRHPLLDSKINESRLKSEVKIMRKLATKMVSVPLVVSVDEENYAIKMWFISGPKVKDYLNDPSTPPEKIDVMLNLIGLIIKKVHEAGVIHGDLTTSNMIVNEKGFITLIDFGLSYFKESAEDRAVDLYVLERAFKSTHPAMEDKFNIILSNYGDEAALRKLEVVRQRGRKKVAFG